MRAKDTMREKVQLFLQKYHMIEESDHVVAGISGGADSVCLLLILKELREKLRYRLTAVHVEHGIRGEESLADAAFVKAFCERQQIPLMTFSVDAPGRAKRERRPVEEAARELRYDCFCRACGDCGGTKIAVAHHGNDCAETVLFHLIRGTGIRGLCGIAPVRPAKAAEDGAAETTYPVIRPLLCVTRDEIEAFLTEAGQEYRTDSTNSDLRLARNRIRGKVMPELDAVNAAAVQHMVRTAGHLAEICDYLDEAAWESGKEGVICSYEDGRLWEVRILIRHFLTLHPVLQKNLLHRLLGDLSGSRRDITARHLEAVGTLLAAGTGKRIALPYGIEARNEYGAVVLSRSGEEAEADTEARELSLTGETACGGFCFRAEILKFDGNFEKIPQKTYTKWFDYDKIKNTVQIRTRRTGDFLQIDMSGGHRKLKDYFIDVKLPRHLRDRIPLLADGSHILWAVGFRVSEGYKVTEDTRRILAVYADKGEKHE